MRLFYEKGEAHVSMSLTEFQTAIDDAQSSMVPSKAPSSAETEALDTSPNDSANKARKEISALVARRKAGRKRVGGTTGRMVKATGRMVSRRPLTKATSKPKRKVAKRDWGPIIAKRNAMLERKREEQMRREQ